MPPRCRRQNLIVYWYHWLYAAAHAWLPADMCSSDPSFHASMMQNKNKKAPPIYNRAGTRKCKSTSQALQPPTTSYRGHI